MTVKETEFKGLLVIEPNVHADARGFLMESYHSLSMSPFGVNKVFVQENQSHSVKNVIRGLHFQKGPHAQAKLVRAIYGAILDVVVDLRRSEKTFGKTHAIELSAENRLQLYVPAGFAHGFSVLSESAGVLYKCDQHYHPETEGGIAYNDPELGINWKVPKGLELVSEKDLRLPLLSSNLAVF